MKTPIEELARMSSDERRKTVLFEAAVSWEEDRILGRGERIYRDEYYVAPAEEHRVQMDVTDEEWGMLSELVESKIKHHQAYIDRAINNPTDTIRSSETVERHRGLKRKWKSIQDKMSENVW